MGKKKHQFPALRPSPAFQTKKRLQVTTPQALLY